MGMRKILEHDITGPTEQRGGWGGGGGVSHPSPKFSVDVPFYVDEPY